MKSFLSDLIKALFLCILIVLMVFLSIGYSSNFIYVDF